MNLPGLRVDPPAIRSGQCPLPVSHSSWEGRVDNKFDKLAVAALFFGDPAMHEELTTVIIQRYLDALPGVSPHP